ncbi:hypothetical protein PMAYCL1PPCAC_23594 [Pristionchus mayeri]|uniref:Uncharacterized protein n=1 Tax=Pristionchus mayeri TaxID=1317129 RepID=A0AAN5I6M1_9BILA|nr:hypothetical protein PMAYCL1PPCAC_23594 [Pristionchus mayeri]
MFRHQISKTEKKNKKDRALQINLTSNKAKHDVIKWTAIVPSQRYYEKNVLEGTTSPISIKTSSTFIKLLIGSSLAIRKFDEGTLWRWNLTRSTSAQILSILSSNHDDRSSYKRLCRPTRKHCLSEVKSVYFPSLIPAFSDYLHKWLAFERSGKKNLLTFIRPETAEKILENATSAGDSAALLYISRLLQGALILGALLTTRVDQMHLSMAYSLWSFLQVAHSKVHGGLETRKIWSIINGLSEECGSHPPGYTQLFNFVSLTLPSRVKKVHKKEILDNLHQMIHRISPSDTFPPMIVDREEIQQREELRETNQSSDQTFLDMFNEKRPERNLTENNNELEKKKRKTKEWKEAPDGIAGRTRKRSLQKNIEKELDESKSIYGQQNEEKKKMGKITAGRTRRRSLQRNVKMESESKSIYGEQNEEKKKEDRTTGRVSRDRKRLPLMEEKERVSRPRFCLTRSMKKTEDKDEMVIIEDARMEFCSFPRMHQLTKKSVREVDPPEQSSAEEGATVDGDEHESPLESRRCVNSASSVPRSFIRRRRPLSRKKEAVIKVEEPEAMTDVEEPDRNESHQDIRYPEHPVLFRSSISSSPIMKDNVATRIKVEEAEGGFKDTERDDLLSHGREATREKKKGSDSMRKRIKEGTARVRKDKNMMKFTCAKEGRGGGGRISVGEKLSASRKRKRSLPEEGRDVQILMADETVISKKKRFYKRVVSEALELAGLMRKDGEEMWNAEMENMSAIRPSREKKRVKTFDPTPPTPRKRRSSNVKMGRGYDSNDMLLEMESDFNESLMRGVYIGDRYSRRKVEEGMSPNDSIGDEEGFSFEWNQDMGRRSIRSTTPLWDGIPFEVRDQMPTFINLNGMVQLVERSEGAVEGIREDERRMEGDGEVKEEEGKGIVYMDPREEHAYARREEEYPTGEIHEIIDLEAINEEEEETETITGNEAEEIDASEEFRIDEDVEEIHEIVEEADGDSPIMQMNSSPLEMTHSLPNERMKDQLEITQIINQMVERVEKRETEEGGIDEEVIEIVKMIEEDCE